MSFYLLWNPFCLPLSINYLIIVFFVIVFFTDGRQKYIRKRQHMQYMPERFSKVSCLKRRIIYMHLNNSEVCQFCRRNDRSKSNCRPHEDTVHKKIK